MDVISEVRMRDADRGGGFGLRCAVAVIIFAMAPTMAFAYIDPGSGAYMVQAVFTVVGAALFYVRHPIRAIRAFADRLFAGRRAEGSSSGETFEETELREGAIDKSSQQEKKIA